MHAFDILVRHFSGALSISVKQHFMIVGIVLSYNI